MMFLRRCCAGRFFATTSSSVADEAYWTRMSGLIDWKRKPDRLLDFDREKMDWRWFPGGELNVAWNAVDRHVRAGHGHRVAFKNYSSYFGDPETLQVAEDPEWTYDRLDAEVQRLSAALLGMGVAAGDTVAIYCPTNAYSAAAVLSVMRIAAVPVVVFGGFSAVELAKRLSDSGAIAAITVSAAYEPHGVIAYGPLMQEAIKIASSPSSRWRGCVVMQRQGADYVMDRHDVLWNDLSRPSSPVDAVPVPSRHPAHILHTSGTTALPKGVVRGHGGLAVGLVHAMRSVYGVHGPDQTMFAASDIGWIVGLHFSVLAPLLVGSPSVLLEGKPVWPDAGALWRVTHHSQAKVLFSAPTAFRAVRSASAAGARPAKSSRLRRIYVAGERCDAATLQYLEGLFDGQVPILDHYWMTELGSAALAPRLDPDTETVSPVKYGSAGFPVTGFDMHVLDEAGQPAPVGQVGRLCVRLPMGPGAARTLWSGRDKFVDTYLAECPGFFFTGDEGYVDEDGYFFVVSRADDVIQVAAHRIGTAALEEACCSVPGVAEAAVVGAASELKGQVPVALVVPFKGGNDNDVVDRVQLEADVKRAVDQQVGRFAKLDRVMFVPALPKTRSGKLLRRTLRAIVDGHTDYPVPATIENPNILKEIEQVVKRQH